MVELISVTNVHRLIGKDADHRHAGLTLVECMLAIMILSVTLLAVTYTTNAGHSHLRESDRLLRAVRLAENLLEEIESRSYHGSGHSRSTYGVDDYNGFSETAGNLQDVTGTLYGDAYQRFNRTVSITNTTRTIPDLENVVISGKIVQITVTDARGHQWEIQRFIPEPM